MEGSLNTLINVAIVFFLVLLNSFFVAAEFAMIRSQLTKFKEPQFTGKIGVKSSLKVLKDLDLNLSTCQVGITIASLILGWWGEHTFQLLITRSTEALGITIGIVTSHVFATTLALLIVTYLHVVLGELFAKSVAIRYPETTLRFLAGPLLVFTLIIRPLVTLLNESANLLLRIVRLDSSVHAQRAHSSAELALLIAHSSELGVLDKDEEQMLKGVFSFSETIAREVMTPRTDLVVVHYNATVEQVTQVAAKTGLSRIPVIGDRIDDVLGVLLIKDILPYVANREKKFDVREIMREPYFVPGTKSISDLLREFQGKKVHLAIVLDEHGGVDGIVTLEDLIEEIVGEIFDESDIPETDIIVHSPKDLTVQGAMLVADLNTKYLLSLPEGDYDTIAGFVFTYLGRLPRPGEQLAVLDDDEVLSDQEEIKEALLQFNSQQSGEAEEKDEDSSEKKRNVKVLLVVERVRKRRIDTVRIKSLISEKDNLESESVSDTSNLNNGRVSESGEVLSTERNMSNK